MGIALRILRFRGLLLTLTARELKARYRGSVLGFFWSLANPLLLLGVYTLVFNVIFAPRFPGADPYAVFLITGLFPWIWLATALTEGTESLMSNAALIRKAVFPAEVLPVVSVLANLVHFALALPIVAVALGVSRAFGHPVGGWSVLLLPVVVAAQGVFIAGLALGLAALNAHFKDVKDLLQNLLALGFFLAPIIYPMSAIGGQRLGWVRSVVRANPATPFVLGYQRVLFEGVVPSPRLWLAMVVVAVVAWGVGSWLFGRLSETLVEAV